LWASLVATPPPTAVAEWALRPAEIRVAAHVAAAGDQEVGEVCQRLLMAGTPALLNPLPLPFTWADLVLAPGTTAHLRELEAQAAHRAEVLDDWRFSRLTSLGRGMTALFAGPSGTGKTLAAQVLARSLGLGLYRVDLAGVVSKYIGETEKHLRELFEACERAPVLLLFDEADALFGKRTQVSDAHDRYANIEIDYVLQRMEQFDGIAVLATNRKADLDTAFVRRLGFIIDFAPPSAQEREQLWRLALEGASDVEGRPLVGELNWARLARDLDLTGAGIKSAAVAAAFLARSGGVSISEGHVLAAARRELAKQGVVVRPGQLESP
jgi:SpoVK/Ycf46/Vps4 family AAA+-type ATPase